MAPRRLDLGVMINKDGSTLHRTPEVESHHCMPFSEDIFLGGRLTNSAAENTFDGFRAAPRSLHSFKNILI